MIFFGTIILRKSMQGWVSAIVIQTKHFGYLKNSISKILFSVFTVRAGPVWYDKVKTHRCRTLSSNFKPIVV